MKRKLLSLIFIISLLVTVVYPVYADDAEQSLDQQISDLEKKVAQLKDQDQTLSGQIAYYDSQIALNQLKISQTEDLITRISGKIDLLEKDGHRNIREAVGTDVSP